MLDQLSGGRLEIGFGRGSVPIEIEYYGANPDDAQEVYAEAVELVLQGIDAEGARSSRASDFPSSNVPMEIEPLQKPHPPIWYGVHMPDSAERAARRNLNVVSLDPPKETRLSIDRYRVDLAAGPRGTRRLSQARPRPLRRGGADRRRGDGAGAPRLSCSGTRASPICSAGTAASQSHPRPATFDLVIERGQGIAGSPATVAEFLASQLDETGCNYMVGPVRLRRSDARGDACARSACSPSDVMPALRGESGARTAEEMRRALRRRDAVDIVVLRPTRLLRPREFLSTMELGQNSAVRRRRRHLHRRRGVRRDDRRAAARQDADHAARAWSTGIENGVDQGRRAVSRGAAVPARHHGRDQHHPGAQRRALRAAHHAGLPRHLRDRPRQPAGILQPVLPAARAADRARPALRDHASAWTRRARC